MGVEGERMGGLGGGGRAREVMEKGKGRSIWYYGKAGSLSDELINHEI